jgi:hypothetical protein
MTDDAAQWLVRILIITGCDALIIIGAVSLTPSLPFIGHMILGAVVTAALGALPLSGLAQNDDGETVRTPDDE